MFRANLRKPDLLDDGVGPPGWPGSATLVVRGPSGPVGLARQGPVQALDMARGGV